MANSVQSATIGSFDQIGARSSSSGRVLNIDPERFAADFNRRHFEVSHQLADHPLFQIPRLLELAREMSEKWPRDIYYDLGVENIGERWRMTAPEVSVEQVMQRLETSKAWIDFKSAERSREYGKVLNNVMCDLLKLSGRQLERTMRRKQMAIFVTSPNRISTYHMDSEVNFLLQIRGEKEISLFDRTDREVLTEQECERFWTVDTNAATYKPDLQHRADVVKLRPGNGVHIPVNAPHWVKNGNNISVSAAMLYHSYNDAYANVYGTNYYLRTKLGMKPTPPFKSKWLDAVKEPIGAMIQSVRSRYHGPLRDVGVNAEGIWDLTPDEAFR